MPYNYIIQEFATSHYKIGFSENVQDRLNQHQTSNSNLLVMVYKSFSVHSELIESLLHQLYKDTNKRGEWFELENKDVMQCIDIIKSTQKKSVTEIKFIFIEKEKEKLIDTINKVSNNLEELKHSDDPSNNLKSIQIHDLEKLLIKYNEDLININEDTKFYKKICEQEERQEKINQILKLGKQIKKISENKTTDNKTTDNKTTDNKTTDNNKTNDNKYKCVKCKYYTNDKTNFNRHNSSKTHINNKEIVVEDKNFKCTICNKIYTFASGLSKHKKKCIKKQANLQMNKESNKIFVEMNDRMKDLEERIILLQNPEPLYFHDDPI